MKIEITIRNAAKQDVDSLVRFNLAMAIETEDKILDEQILNRGVSAVFDEPNRGFYMVAEAEGKVIGSLMVTYEWSDWRDGVFWWVQSVHVEPEFRRCGVFRSLYAKVKERALSNGCVCGCRLYVEQDNEIAQATYRQLGFKENNYKFFEEMYS